MGNNSHRSKSAAGSRMRIGLMAAAIASCIAQGAAYANPQGGVVTNGQATFNTQGNVFTITNTPGTIINWQNFSINANETTRFLQQSASSAVLNRIVGQNPSQILGALQSNGKVFLINPNGILFGRGAQVDTNGLVASSLDIADQDFLAGRKKFIGGANAGAVENQGMINTPSGGQVYLIAPSVTNSGIITSPQGEVILAAGHSVQLADSANPDLHVVVSAPQDKALNLGQIIAHSGKVGIYGALVDQNGTVNADSAVVGKNGKIVLKASGDTILGDGSFTSATGAGTGGTVQVLGERVGMAGDAQIDASGRTGGGTVLVGGDYHGGNAAIPNAKRTYIGSDARIKADATENGNGGKVIVWSDEVTRDYGSISARGGTQGGDGGFVESSGKQMLDHHAKVDVSAPKGKGGTLLLDPATITLVGGTGDGGASPDGTTTFQGGATPGTVNFADSDLTSAGVSNIYQSELEGLAPGTNIVLEATDYITATGSFSNLVTLPTNSNLTMRTRNASTDGTGTIGIDLVNSADSSNLEFKTQGSGTITLQTGTGASPQAALIDVGKLTTAGGSITVNASGNVVLRGATTTPGGGNGGDISLTSGGYMTLGGANIDARGAGGSDGNVTLKSGGPISLQTGKLIYGNQLQMTAAGGINGSASTDMMTTQVSSLNALNTGSGSILIDNSSPSLSIVDIGSVGYGVKNTATGGGIQVSTASGQALNINAPVSANNGQVTLNGAGGVNLFASTAPEISSNGGVVNLSASDAGAMISTAAGSQISSNGGTISLKADKMQLLGSTNATSSGVVLLAPATSATGIDLGTVNTDLNSTLELSNTELGGITANTLAVGDANSGAIDIKSMLTSGFSAMSLTSGSTITQQPGALLGGALSFKLNGSAVTLLEANPTGVIAGSTSSGDFQYRSANGIAVSTVDGMSGITTPGSANVKLVSDSASGINQSDPIVTGSLALQSAGPVMLTNPGNNFSVLTADLSSGTGNLQVFDFNNLSLGAAAGGNGITTNNGGIDVSVPSANTLTVNQAVNAGSGAVNLNGGNLALASGASIDGSAIALSATQPGTGTISVMGAGVRIGDTAATNTTDVLLEADNVNFVQAVPTVNAGHSVTYVNVTDDLPISTSTFAGATWNAPYFVIGNATVSDGNTTGDIAVDGALNQGGKSIVLLSGGSISQTAPITASELAINAGTNTGSASSVQLNSANAVDSIAAATNGGGFSFNGANALTVSSITDGVHGLTGILSGGGTVGVTAAGDLTVSSPIAAGAGTVLLNSSTGQVGGTALVSGNTLSVQAANGISLQTQATYLSANNAGGANPISFANVGTLHLENFQQNGTGGVFVNNTGSLFTDFCDCNFYGGTGGLNLTTDSALTLNGNMGLGTGNLAFNAGVGAGDTLTINTNIASSGNVILKAGDAISLNNGDTISANQLQIVAGGGIYGTASTDPMVTQVATVNASNSGTGPIYISNSGSNLSIADIGSVGFGVKNTAGGGMINISTGTGETLNLTAPISTSNGAINLTGAGGINLSASTAPEISSNGGVVNLSASDAGAMISTAAGSQISSNGGTISLKADKMQLLGSTNATSSGVVLLAPATSATGIDLGTVNTDLNSTLELSNTELGGITANTLAVGDANSGAIDIKSMLTSGFSAMSLTSGSTITQQPGALLGGALSFKLTGSAVTLLEANPTGVIAGSTSSGDFQYRSSNGIAVSTVDGQSGIATASGGSVKLVSDSTSGINQSAPIVATNLALQSAGPVVLTDVGNDFTGLAADLSGAASGTSNIQAYSSNDLALTSAFGINGITTNNSSIGISASSAKTLTVSQGVNAGNAAVTLDAGNLALGGGATVDGGTIFLSAKQAGTGAISTTGAGARVGDAAATNTTAVTLEADTLNFAQGGPTINAGQTITYVNASDGQGISTSGLSTATLNAPNLVIGNNVVSDPNTTGDITIDGGLDQTGKTIVLLAGGNISQTATLTASSLLVDANTSTGATGSVYLNSGNVVDNIAAATHGGAFSLNDTTSLTTASVTDGTHSATGVVSGGGTLSLTAASGDLTISSPVDAGAGSAMLSSSNGKILGTGIVSANNLSAHAADGVSLQTQVSNLSATNDGGTNPISITNTGTLHLQNFQQNGTGDITVDNTGPMYVDNCGCSFYSTSGNINLTAHSPLTVDGSVSSTSGDITLYAGATGTYGAGDTLTINGSVSSTSGNVFLKAGDAIVIGGTATLSAGGASGVTQTPNLNLPSLATCISAPTTPNCSLVLPSLATCTASPTTAGCSVVLPSLATCTASPTTAGCSAVLPSLATCTAAPTTAGCSAVLPSLATCTAAPTTAGCSAVLPSLATCTAAPTTAGCSAVLPSLATCTASPATAGCSAVLPSLATCTAAPTTAGCSVVLPSLATCTAVPTQPGCSVVLPSLATCVASPTTAGCGAVLPSLAICTAAPATAGCGVVLPSLAACTAAPTKPGCSVVLPTLDQCVANPALAGCQAVLPLASSSSDGGTDQVIQSTVTLLNKTTSSNSVSGVDDTKGTSDDDKKGDKKDSPKDDVTTKDSGAKKDDATKKMYCN